MTLDSTCPGCGKVFRQESGLRQHLSHRPDCAYKKRGLKAPEGGGQSERYASGAHRRERSGLLAVATDPRTDPRLGAEAASGGGCRPKCLSQEPGEGTNTSTVKSRFQLPLECNLAS